MKRLLLDTHAFSWWVAGSRGLSRDAKAAIAEGESLVHVSAATIWEIAIMENLGKIDLKGIRLEEEIEKENFIELPISARHAQHAGSLPRHHDVPFDRMLIAQAEIEDLVIVTHDKAFRLYGIFILST